MLSSYSCCLPIVVYCFSYSHCFCCLSNALLSCVAHNLVWNEKKKPKTLIHNIRVRQDKCCSLAATWLTLSLGDGAADGGAGGGDGAHGGAHAIRRVHPRHGRRVGHPGSGVNGSDGFTWEIREQRVRWGFVFLIKRFCLQLLWDS